MAAALAAVLAGLGVRLRARLTTGSVADSMAGISTGTMADSMAVAVTGSVLLDWTRRN